MKKIDNREVCRKLAKQILTQTEGVDCTEGEAEITYKGVLFWVNYQIIREYVELYSETYLTPAEYDEIIHIEILDFAAYNTEEEQIQTTFDPSVIIELIEK